jgi:hypothetical protein
MHYQMCLMLGLLKFFFFKGQFCPNIFKVVSLRIPAHSIAKYQKNVVKYPLSIYGVQNATPTENFNLGELTI